jgi:hypothetical protein
VSKEQQAVYDVIKNVREGNPTKHTFDGIEYLIVPMAAGDDRFFVYEEKVIPYSYYLSQDVLAKYHGNKIGVITISWKDAGPNPRFDRGFIPFKNIYGIAIKMKEINERTTAQNGEGAAQGHGCSH